MFRFISLFPSTQTHKEEADPQTAPTHQSEELLAQQEY